MVWGLYICIWVVRHAKGLFYIQWSQPSEGAPFQFLPVHEYMRTIQCLFLKKEKKTLTYVISNGEGIFKEQSLNLTLNS